MLDPENTWETPSGGWFAAERVGQDDTRYDAQDVDLWASVYASKLLVRVVSCPEPAGFSPQERSRAEEQLDATLFFLNEEWTAKKWAYGGLEPEESAVLLFIEVFSVLAKRDARLVDLCLKHFGHWLTPGGNLSDGYRKRLSGSPVRDEQLLARMAYAFYLAGDARWRKMFDSASQGNLDGLYSSELAFLLDMSFSYEPLPGQGRSHSSTQ